MFAFLFAAPGSSPSLITSIKRILVILIILTFFTSVDKHNYFVYLPSICSKYFKTWDNLIDKIEQDQSFSLNMRNYEKTLRKMALWQFQADNKLRIKEKKQKKQICSQGLEAINLKLKQLENGELLLAYQAQESSMLNDIQNMVEAKRKQEY